MNTADVVQINNTFASDDWRKLLVHENFMDKSIKIQPNEILKTMRESFKNLMKNPQQRELKRALAAFALSFAGAPFPARAADPFGGFDLPGQISYSKFIEAVKNDSINSVKVVPSGLEARF